MIPAKDIATLMGRLPTVILLARHRRRLNIREAAGQADISVSTFSRLENGYYCDVRTLVKILQWLES